MKKLLINLMCSVIEGYRILISPLLGQNCRFSPCCSLYAIEALKNHGFRRGLILTGWRLCRCQPWGEPGYDPVPEKKPSVISN